MATANQALISALIDEIVTKGKEFQSSSNEEAKLKVVNAASKLITELESPMDQLARMCWGEPSRHAALQTVFELGIFKKLNLEKPLSSVELVEGTSADPALVSRMLKHLAAYNLINETTSDQYLATPFTLASEDPAMNAGMIYCFDMLPSTYARLPGFLSKTKYQNPTDKDNGPLAYGLQTDKNFFGYLQHHAEIGKAFNTFMGGHMRARPRWVDCYPCAERLTLQDTKNNTTKNNSNEILIIDVGGGLGHCLSDFRTKHPDIPGQLILQDQAHIISEATQQLPPQSNIKPAIHDFMQPQPTQYRGARAYFLRQIMHDWSDENCVKILTHLRNAMTPNYSRILINEHVVSDTGAVWQQTSLDMTMMTLLSSLERTEGQWHALLAKAGLKINGIWQKDVTSEAVIEAVLIEDSSSPS